MRRTPDNFLRLARRYGDIVHFKIGPQRFFLLSHPDQVKDVLVSYHSNFLRGWGPQRGHSVMGEGVLTSEGEQHRRQRRLLQPAFHKQAISAYAEMMVGRGTRMRESWTNGQLVDIECEMRRLTLAIVCQALFDAEVEPEAQEVAAALKVLMRRFSGLMFPYAGWLKKFSPRSSERRLRNARKRLDRVIDRIIDERRQDYRERSDLLSRLLLGRDQESGDGLTDIEVRDEVMTLFLAGHETTAVTLSWLWYLLSQNPEAEAALHDELDTLLDGRTPTVEVLPHLRYTGMVVAETLRLYPPQWMIGRRAINDYEVGGYTAPAGSFVLMSPYVLHHDPRCFPDPFCFDPLRWTEGAQKSRPQYSYLPFGAGPRGCIGEGFAWMEITLLVATLAQHWRIRIPRNRQVRAEPLLILRPKNGIHVRLERRK